MKGYEATMKKEIAREFAHGVMGAACRVKLKKGSSPILEIISKNMYEEICKIPNMTIEEVENLNIISKFMMKALVELENI